MRVNWRKFWTVFALMQVVFLTCGCAASWLGAISALLPALEAAVSAAISFVMALEGKTVPATVSAAIQKIGSEIAAQISSVQQIIAAASGAATSGVISEIQAVFQAITANLASILTNFQVTDSGTITKLTQLIGLAVAAVQAILGFIPLVQAKLATPGVTNTQLEAEDGLAAVHINNAHKSLQEAYVVIRDTPTDNTDVNEALRTLPVSLP